MWQLNADDFFGAVPKGSHGPPENAHEKNPMLGSWSSSRKVLKEVGAAQAREFFRFFTKFDPPTNHFSSNLAHFGKYADFSPTFAHFLFKIV